MFRSASRVSGASNSTAAWSLAASLSNRTGFLPRLRMSPSSVTLRPLRRSLALNWTSRQRSTRPARAFIQSRRYDSAIVNARSNDKSIGSMTMASRRARAWRSDSSKSWLDRSRVRRISCSRIWTRSSGSVTDALAVELAQLRPGRADLGLNLVEVLLEGLDTPVQSGHVKGRCVDVPSGWLRSAGPACLSVLRRVGSAVVSRS